MPRLRRALAGDTSDQARSGAEDRVLTCCLLTVRRRATSAPDGDRRHQCGRIGERITGGHDQVGVEPSGNAALPAVEVEGSRSDAGERAQGVDGRHTAGDELAHRVRQDVVRLGNVDAGVGAGDDRRAALVQPRRDSRRADWFAATVGRSGTCGSRPTVDETATPDAARRSINSSGGSQRSLLVKNVQCSIESTLVSRASSMAVMPWQWAATGTPSRWAASTTSRSSRSVNWLAHIGTVGVRNPPLTITLTTSHPRSTRSLTASGARRHRSTRRRGTSSGHRRW